MFATAGVQTVSCRFLTGDGMEGEGRRNRRKREVTYKVVLIEPIPPLFGKILSGRVSLSDCRALRPSEALQLATKHLQTRKASIIFLHLLFFNFPSYLLCIKVRLRCPKRDRSPKHPWEATCRVTVEPKLITFDARRISDYQY